ncbi:MAG: ribonuclease HII [Cryomorphaceae bacterium]|nr:ribonuclease HII [Cryomorphaceae bacterium]
MLSRFSSEEILEAGCDEAGRGCLAGPVVAAAVILPPDFHHPLLDDSKKLSEKNREMLRPIIESEAIAWEVALCTPAEVDRLNILWASVEAMHRAVRGLVVRPDVLLIDGNRFKPYDDIPHHCMVKGDGRFLAIAAASILAKTHRDEMMRSLHDEFPQYGWLKNKGYPTKKHRSAIYEIGACKHHRKSFTLLQLQIDFPAS